MEDDSKALSVRPYSDRTETETSRVASGKLHRRTKESSRLPRNAASISTKHQSEVFRKPERKGFSVQARRFNVKAFQTGNPGLGAYMSHGSADVISPSFSKRGTGGLASQAARIPPPRHGHTPAPNAYNLQSSLILNNSFSQVGSSAFQPPIAVTTESFRNATPAPNQYQVSFTGVERNTAVSAQSVFLSRTGRRNPYSAVSDWPSPCEYSVDDALTRPAPRVPFSCFRSGSARILCLATSRVPGPGTYSPHKRPDIPRGATLPRGHYLCLSAPAVPPPKPAPLPGPGQYDLTSCDAPPKQPLPRAVFLSGRSRWDSAVTGGAYPGPGYYDPTQPERQSFLFNQYKKWVPA